MEKNIFVALLISLAFANTVKPV